MDPTARRRRTELTEAISGGIGLSDDALMRRACADDPDAFAELYDRHGARAFRVARAVCGDREEAEDAVREGFLTIWRGRESYGVGVGDFQAWSIRIVQSRATVASRGTAGQPLAPPPNEYGDHPLLASLRLLPEAQAEVIVLAVFGDLTHEQIAKQLDLPADTVEGRMRLGLEKLRDQMTVTGKSHTDPPQFGEE